MDTKNQSRDQYFQKKKNDENSEMLFADLKQIFS